MSTPQAQRSITFRARLTSGVTLLCLLVLTLAGAGVYLGARTALLRNLDDALYSIAKAELASSLDGPNGSVHVHDEESLTLHLTSEAGYEKYAQILDIHGCVVMQTHNFTQGPPFQMDTQRMERAKKGEASFTDIMRGTETYRAIYYPMKDNSGSPLVTMCAVPKRPLQRSLDMLLITLILTLTLSGLVAAWGANRLARRMTRPLEDMAATACLINDKNLGQRLQTTAPDVELQGLTTVLNGMLTRLENALAARQTLIESQRRFITDASHELRSPLTNLRGTIEVALRRPRTEAEYRETLTASMTEIERLSRLTNDLLMLSRADAQQLRMERMPTDLTQIVQQAITAFQARAVESQVRLCLEAAGANVVCADPMRLRQVIDNLLDNALQYAPTGTTVELQLQQDEGYVLLTVRDYGIGLSPEDQERIFDRFYRTDKARTRHTGGLGLGLSIVKTIVEAHGGHIKVQSQPGRGTAFTISLPQSQGE